MNSFFQRKLRSIDAFGAPIGVNYKGNDTYQTKLGGVVSLVTFVVILFYAVYQTYVMWSYTGSTFTSLQTAINLHGETIADAVDLGQDNFEVFLGLRQSTTGIIIQVPPEIGRLKATQTTQMAPG